MDLYDRQTIRRLAANWEVLLGAVAENADAGIWDLPVLAEPERRQVLVTWNDAATEYPRDKCIHELFEDQASRIEDSVAVACELEQLTYRTLNERANRLANHLRRKGVRPDIPVALCMQRGLGMVVGLLAILKAGGAYLPLDPTYPSERLEFMLEDTAAPVLVSEVSTKKQLPASVREIALVDGDWEEIEHESPTNPVICTAGANLAYVMYTSGSTGRPKGVCVEHRNVNRLVVNTNYVDIGAGDRIAQMSNASFDAATFEIWGALVNGGVVEIISKEIALSGERLGAAVKEKGITTMFITTALFNELAVNSREVMGGMREVLFGGEAVDARKVRKVLREGGPQRLLHVYGPTEGTTFTTWEEVREVGEEARTVPIGKPIGNTTVYLLDEKMEPVPIGVVGELYLGGEGLGRGYWERSDQTAERFVHNPHGAEGDRLYKTGDLARYRDGGRLDFIGRRDHQVKIRGYRIETGEVEAELARHPDVDETVVMGLATRQAKRDL